MQKQLLRDIGDGDLLPGHLWTFATLAVPGGSVPRAAIPKIDRVYDENRDELGTLAYALVWEDMPDRASHLERLKELLVDVVPDKAFDVDGVPVALEGLVELADRLAFYRTYHPSTVGADIEDRLRALYLRNGQYARASDEGNVTGADHEAWHGDVDGQVGGIVGLMPSLSNNPEGTAWQEGEP